MRPYTNSITTKYDIFGMLGDVFKLKGSGFDEDVTATYLGANACVYNCYISDSCGD